MRPKIKGHPKAANGQEWVLVPSTPTHTAAATGTHCPGASGSGCTCPGRRPVDGWITGGGGQRSRREGRSSCGDDIGTSGPLQLEWWRAGLLPKSADSARRQQICLQGGWRRRRVGRGPCLLARLRRYMRVPAVRREKVRQARHALRDTLLLSAGGHPSAPPRLFRAGREVRRRDRNRATRQVKIWPIQLKGRTRGPLLRLRIACRGGEIGCTCGLARSAMAVVVAAPLTESGGGCQVHRERARQVAWNASLCRCV